MLHELRPQDAVDVLGQVRARVGDHLSLEPCAEDTRENEGAGKQDPGTGDQEDPQERERALHRQVGLVVDAADTP